METSSPLYNLDYFGETMEQKDRSSHCCSGEWENISFLSPFSFFIYHIALYPGLFYMIIRKNFQETEKKLKYFGARMFWINFVPRIPSSRRCFLIKVYFLRSVWHLERIILRKSAISQSIWPLSLVFTFFFMKENRRVFSFWMNGVFHSALAIESRKLLNVLILTLVKRTFKMSS